jgi:hypothetical protein
LSSKQELITITENTMWNCNTISLEGYRFPLILKPNQEGEWQVGKLS